MYFIKCRKDAEDRRVHARLRSRRETDNVGKETNNDKTDKSTGHFEGKEKLSNTKKKHRKVSTCEYISL